LRDDGKLPLVSIWIDPSREAFETGSEKESSASDTTSIVLPGTEGDVSDADDWVVKRPYGGTR
jgi:hypothetical protein